MNKKVIIVDDEALGREIIKEFLEDFSELSVVAECENGTQAVAAIERHQPDVVFLDVQMPAMNGFEVLQQLATERLPQIIFCTAHDRFALKAFEVNAVDYLLKPFTRKRFEHAVRKALTAAPAPPEFFDRMLALLQHAQQKQKFTDRLLIRQGSKIIPIATADILRIEAAGDYAHIHTAGKTYLSNIGIGELEKRLDPQKFARVHRSNIVALSAIQHLRSDGEGGYHAVLHNGATVRISRTYAPRVRALIV